MLRASLNLGAARAAGPAARAAWPRRPALGAQLQEHRGSEPRTPGIRASFGIGGPSEARSRLYQRRFSHPNTHFSAFFEIYEIDTLMHSSTKFNAKEKQSFVRLLVISITISKSSAIEMEIYKIRPSANHFLPEIMMKFGRCLNQY